MRRVVSVSPLSVPPLGLIVAVGEVFVMVGMLLVRRPVVSLIIIESRLPPPVLVLLMLALLLPPLSVSVSPLVVELW